MSPKTLSPSALSLFVVLALGGSPALIAGCTSATEELEEQSDALIKFPAAAYAGAAPIAYGGSSTRPFTTADKFVAVKFNGKKGDIVRFQVSAPRAAVSYLVFNKRNVAALRNPADPSGTFRFTLASDGEYFIMMRTRDRKDAPITVKLEALSASGAGAFSNADLVANAPPGSAPNLYLPQLQVSSVVFRECVTATGCGPSLKSVKVLKNVVDYGNGTRRLRQTTYEPVLVTQQLWAPPTGVTGVVTFTGTALAPGANGQYPEGGSVVAADAAPWHQRYFDATSSEPLTGKVTLTLLDGTTKYVPFDYTLTYTRSLFHLSLRSEVSRAGVQWSEYSAEIESPIPALAVAERPPSTPAPRDGGITADETPLDDEEVLSRFPAGAVEMPVFASPTDRVAHAASFSIGYEGYRYCAPRTGCSAWTKDALDDNFTSPGKHIIPRPFGFGVPMTVKLRVTGDDSYEVVIGAADSPHHDLHIAIEEGVGTFTAASSNRFGATTYKVKVTAQGLLFEAPFATKVDTQDAQFPEAPSGQMTNREPGYTREYYWNPSMLVKFNQNW